MAKTTASLAFNLYEGFVEDIKDPKKSGRVRVRVKTIHSYEGEGKDRVGIPPTEELPWATVMMPTTHATSTHQISNHNLKVGDAVVVLSLIHI